MCQSFQLTQQQQQIMQQAMKRQIVSLFCFLLLLLDWDWISNNFLLLLLLHTALIKNPVQLTPFQHETLLVQALRNLYYQQNPRANGSYAYLPALMGTHYESYDTRYIPLGELSLILLIFILWFLSIALCLSKYRKLRSLHPFIPPYPGDPPMHIEEGLLFWIQNGSKFKKNLIYSIGSKEFIQLNPRKKSKKILIFLRSDFWIHSKEIEKNFPFFFYFIYLIVICFAVAFF